MPAHWLQVESCRAGFKSEWKSSLNALFSVGYNERWHRQRVWSLQESVKVIQGRVAHGTLYVRLTCIQWTTAITSWVKFQNSNGKELKNLIYQCFRHFRNKIKSVDRAFLLFPCPQAWWSPWKIQEFPALQTLFLIFHYFHFLQESLDGVISHLEKNIKLAWACLRACAIDTIPLIF